MEKTVVGWQNASVTITDQLGQIVKQPAGVNGKQCHIATDGLENGLYLLRVEEPGKQSISGEFIRHHH